MVVGDDPAPLHGQDHWFRVRFHGQGWETLRFQGLATLAEVWLNGRKVLSSDNMFTSHEVDAQLELDNELFICFRALDPVLAKSGSAGRWRPRMITPSSLRNVRPPCLDTCRVGAPRSCGQALARCRRVRHGSISVKSTDVRAPRSKARPVF